MKPIHLVAALAVTALLPLATSAAHAEIFVYHAALSGASEEPSNASPGAGSATVTRDDTAKTMRVEAGFSGLLGATTAAHIHCCTADPIAGNAGVATMTPTFSGFPLGVTAGDYDMTFDLTQASIYNPAFLAANGGDPGSAMAALFVAMADGKAYFNIHSSVYGGGEIRGFLLPARVPEPGSAALLALGAVALAGAARRRHAQTPAR